MSAQVVRIYAVINKPQVLHRVKQALDGGPGAGPELLKGPDRVLLAAASLLHDLGYPTAAEPGLWPTRR